MALSSPKPRGLRCRSDIKQSADVGGLSYASPPAILMALSDLMAHLGLAKDSMKTWFLPPFKF
jgi:hypothetical protein